MAREIVGMMVCPECGHDGAQVKTAKSGLLYRYCPECDAQYFARTQAASDRLAAKVGAGAGTGEKPAAAPEAHPVPGTGEKPAARAGFSLGGL